MEDKKKNVLKEILLEKIEFNKEDYYNNKEVEKIKISPTYSIKKLTQYNYNYVNKVVPSSQSRGFREVMGEVDFSKINLLFG